jgi:Zn-dependent protease with chaperone function
MTGWIAGSFEAFAVSASAAILTSVAVGALLPQVRAIRSAARRADTVFVLGLLPMAVAVISWAALMLPSVLHVTGLRVDHCDLHSHHAHLCALHSGGHRVLLVAFGGLAGVVTLLRAGKLASVQWTSAVAIAKLEGLGTPDGQGPFPVVTVPGSPWLCVAAGGWRRRVILSGSLAQEMAPHHIRAVLAHEYAHLHRNDPFTKVLLAWAGLFATPVAAQAVQDQFSDAAEQASDAEAAMTVGPLDLAESLISVARIVRCCAPATGMAFGGSSLEQRVASLVDDVSDVRPSRATGLALGLAVLVAVAIPLGADTIHHAVETLLGFFG